MTPRRPGEREWYRRNWKTVFGVWGGLLGLLGLVAAIGWTVIRLTRPKPHVHVRTNLKVVDPSDEYPLKTCIVSGKPLPARSRRVAVLYMGREVQFCCGNCIPRFERDPEEYMNALR